MVTFMVTGLDIQSAAIAWTTVLSLALLVVALLAYRRAREARILLISSAFGLFFVKNLILTYMLFSAESGNLLLYSSLFDTAILLSFYVALFRRRVPGEGAGGP